MIVNSSKNGWEIIFQRAHALLAGQIAMQWKTNQRPNRWTETLAAIIDHDDAQRGWRKGEHLTRAGAPMDFTLLELDLEQAKNTVDHARYRSRWIALLTSMHTSVLYEKMRGQSEKVDAFLDEQQSYQQKLRLSLEVKKEAAERAYRLMFLCDACSLVLCKDEIPAGGRKLELGLSPDGESCYIYAKEQDLITIEPWLFETTHFQVSIETFHLNQLVYKSDQELYQAIDRADIKVKHWQFQR